ncbi:MAG: DUF4340 domain-containing protein [bacterium]
MKEKYLKIFAVVFVVLLIIFFVTKPRRSGVNIEELVQNIIIGVAKEDVQSIEIYKQTDTDEPVKITFKKQADQWRISTHLNCKAKNNKISKLLNDLLNMTGKVRSSDPNHHEKYSITDYKGIHILLKDETDKTLANLIFGKKPEDRNSSFVRFAGNDKVYFGDKDILSDINIYSNFDTLTSFKQDNFVDLQAVDKDEKDITIIGLISGNKQRIIKKVEKEVEVTKDDSVTTTEKKNVWVLLRNEKEIDLDQKEVEKFVRAVTSIRAQELVDKIGGSFSDMNKSEKYGFQRSRNVLVFKKDEKSDQQNVIFGDQYEEDKGYYMQVQYDKGLVYKVSKSKYDKIFEWIDKLPEIQSE